MSKRQKGIDPMFFLSHRTFLLLMLMGMVLCATPLTIAWAMGKKQKADDRAGINLPAPVMKGSVSVEEAIKARRTRRSFSKAPLTLAEWAQILWAAQGITEEDGKEKRAAPSAGALYPLDIYLILGKGAPEPPGKGVFLYVPSRHMLIPLSNEDLMEKVAEASLHQYWMAEASGMILITAEYARITGKYGERGIRYAHIEAGHVAQNCFLQAESLDLHVGIVGAFEDEALKDLLPIPAAHEPILLLPIGRSR